MEHICPDCEKIFQCPAGSECDDEYLNPDEFPLHQCEECFCREHDVHPITHRGGNGDYNIYQNEKAKGEYEFEVIMKKRMEQSQKSYDTWNKIFAKLEEKRKKQAEINPLKL